MHVVRQAERGGGGVGAGVLGAVGRRSPLRECRGSNLVDDAVVTVCVGPRPHTDGAKFLNGTLRTAVVEADEEDHVVYEPECMPKHELLHFAIVTTAPVRPR